MSVSLQNYEVVSPASLDEALELMADEAGPVTPLAGGTDLMVYLEMGALPPGRYLNLQSIRDLPPPLFFEANGSVALGPLCSYQQVRRSAPLTAAYPILEAAAREVGSLAVQSRGTWIGNVVNASPAADGVPALMACDARIELTSRDGERQVHLDEFYLDYKQTVKRPEELVTRLWLPARQPEHWYFRKVGTRRFQAISKTLLAATVRTDPGAVIQELRLCLASVAPIPLRARLTEERLRGRRLDAQVLLEAVDTLKKEIQPIDDVRSTREYRKQVSCNLLIDFLRGVERADSGLS